MRRFFIDHPAQPGAEYTINNPDANHISNVLRMKPGDEIWLFDGKGSEFKAGIKTISSAAVTVEIIDNFPCRTDSPFRVTVGQALLKNKKMDTTLRQLTELGIDGWLPISTERSVIKIEKNEKKHEQPKTDRWQTIVKESVKQCQRGLIPKIYPAVNFKEALDFCRNYDLNIIFSDKDGETLDLIKTRAQGTKPSSLFLLVGPEGGFTPQEIDLARRHEFIPAGLGPRILKADTAAIAACAIVQSLFGDMGKNG